MDGPGLRLALWPAAVAYSGVVRVRAALYRWGVLRSRRLEGTVISVGNLTVGGTGKTPMVLWLADRLAAEGLRPAILTRGYRGVTTDGDPEILMADEPALLSERLGARAEIAIGKDRYANGKALQGRGFRWFILDDGFQHLSLRRDADVVLLDATAPFGWGYLLPAGRLREPRSAIARADVVVVTRADHAPAIETIVRRFTQAPIFYAQTELDAVMRASAVAIGSPEIDRNKCKFLAFCGIGNPTAFFEDLRRWGFTIVAKRSFRDHHRYSPSDMAQLEREAVEAGAEAMICTEKDIFNWRGAAEAGLRLPIYACRIRLQLSDGDHFWNAIRDAVRRNHPETRR